MASPDILQAQLQELEEQRNEALRDNDAALLREIDQEISNTRNLLRQSERRNEPANAQFVGQDPLSGAFRYQNRITGEVFLSTRQPSASQQAAFDAANPPPAPQPAPPATAAQTVRDDAPAGPTATPEQTVGTDGRVITPTNTGPTNAAVQPTAENSAGSTSGTDAPIKTTEQTQAISTNSNSGQLLPAPTTAGAVAPPGGAVTNPGVAGPKDDAANTSIRTVQNTVDAGGNDDVKIVPQPNILDEYYSYTYSASVYLLTETQHARLQNSRNKTVDGYYLLFQSGGAPNNNGGIRNPPVATTGQVNAPGSAPAASTQSDGGRNPFFPNDFYIDSISLKSIIAGKATGSAHNAAELKFTVIEPSGITLLDNLYNAVQNIAPRDAGGKVNYTAATYLMVIRFYGYDQNGSPVQVAAKLDAEGTSDRSAVIEKFIPFKIANLNWRVESKLVSYEWDCTPVGLMIAGSTARGTIPSDVQLVNSTVGGLLGNNRATTDNTNNENQNPGTTFLRPQSAAQNSTDQSRLSDNERATQNYNNSNEFAGMQEQGTSSAPRAAPSTASAAPGNKGVSGLMATMNEIQQSLVQRGIYTTADVYSIEFVGPGAKEISGARLQLPNAKVDKKQTASGASPAQVGGAALDSSRQSVDMVSRNFSITAGQQLLQVIEQVIRNSSYITDQALVVMNANGTYTANPKANPDKPMKWFEISMTATAIGDKIDPLRNDYAYNIKYVVRQKTIPNFDSKYFPISTFTGVHKSYPYWFTGQNTAVMEYQETLNALYHVTVSGDAKVGEDRTKREAYTSSLADVRKYAYSPRSNASTQGAKGKEFELGANAAEVIYSPGDLAETKVKIIGDPDWIQQGSLFRAAEQIISAPTGFDPDGSISFDSTMPMFEIVWQRPQDYNINTGLADPYSTQPGEYNRTPQQSRVYVAHTVTSDFVKGAFTQQLEGALYLFPVPGKDKPVANPTDTARKTPAKVKAVAPQRSTDQSVLAINQAATRAYDASNEFAGLTTDTATSAGAQSNSRPAPAVNLLAVNQAASAAYDASNEFSGLTSDSSATVPVLAGAPRQPTSGAGSGTVVTDTLNTGIANSAPGRLPPSPNAVTPSNRAAASQGSSVQSPNTPTNAANQRISKEA